MGRCPYKVGISASGTKAVNRIAKKRIPPREKNAAVLSPSLRNTVPIMTDMIKKELEVLSKVRPGGKLDSQNLCGLWGYITLQDLKASDYNRSCLHRDRYDVGASFSRRLGMFILYLPRISLGQIALSDKIFSVRIHVSFVDRSDVTFKELPGEIVCGARCPIFEPFQNFTSIGVCDGDEEVRSGLTICRFESEMNEVLTSEIRGTEIDHATFVDEADLIEEFTDALRSLISSEGSSDTSDVRCSAESGDELQSCRRI